MSGSGYTAMSSDVKLWEAHFKKMVDGKVKPNRNGIFVVEKAVTSPPKESDSSPHYKMITPSAQALEIAQSDIKHAGEQPKDTEPITYFPNRQESTTTPSTIKKKRGRPPKKKGVPPVAVETNSAKKKKTKEEFWKLY